LMTENEDFITGGLAAMGYWLKQGGFEGFEVKDLNLIDIGVKIGIGVSGKLPLRSEFFARSGVRREYQQQLQDAMVDLSRVVGQALEVGYKPKQVVAALFIQSTAPFGDERAETSLPTRDMLNRTSGNNLAGINQILNRWIRGK